MTAYTEDMRFLFHRDPALHAKLDLLTVLLQLHNIKEELYMTTILESVRAATAELRTSIEALAGRLADNPTAAEVEEIATELNALTDTVDSLDPDVPGGAIDETQPTE